MLAPSREFAHICPLSQGTLKSSELELKTKIRTRNLQLLVNTRHLRKENGLENKLVAKL